MKSTLTTLILLLVLFSACKKQPHSPGLPLPVGNNWAYISAPGEGDFFALKFSSPKTGYIFGDGSNGQFLLKSIDGGLTWNIIKQFSFDFLPKFFCFTPASDDTILLARNKFYASVDGGQSWNPIQNPQDSFFAQELITVPGHTRYSLANSTLYRQHGGSNWTLIKTFAVPGYSLIQFTDSLTGFVGGGNFVEKDANKTGTSYGLLSKTIDGGKSWTQIDTGFWETKTQRFRQIVAFSFVNNSVGFLATDDGSLEMTADGGISWFIVNKKLGGFVTDMVFTSPKTGYYILGNDIYVTTDGGLTTSIDMHSTSTLSKFYSGSNGIFAVGNNHTILKRKSN